MIEYAKEANERIMAGIRYQLVPVTTKTDDGDITENRIMEVNGDRKRFVFCTFKKDGKTVDRTRNNQSGLTWFLDHGGEVTEGDQVTIDNRTPEQPSADEIRKQEYAMRTDPIVLRILALEYAEKELSKDYTAEKTALKSQWLSERQKIQQQIPVKIK